MKAELKLQSAHPDDFDSDDDFHEDVLDAAESDDAPPDLLSDTTGAEDDAAAASAGETPPPSDDEPLPDVQGPMRHLGEASMSPRMHACFRRWQITMSVALRTL